MKVSVYKLHMNMHHVTKHLLTATQSWREISRWRDHKLKKAWRLI